MNTSATQRSFRHTRSARLIGVLGSLLLTGSILTPSVVTNTQAQTVGPQAIRDEFINNERIVIRDGNAPREASPYPSTITVRNLPNRLYDVNVRLRGFSHDNPDDVDILLKSPDNKIAVILSDAGGTTEARNLTFTLDDESSIALPDSDPLSNGATYAPDNYGNEVDRFPTQGTTQNVRLATFDGINPNGTWRLYVVDDNANGASGEIASGWELQILYGEKPEAVNDNYSTPSGRTLRVSAEDGVLANDTDGDPEQGVDSDLTARLKREPKNGTVSLRENGAFTYRPDRDARGSDSFVYTVRDDDGLTNNGRVTIRIGR